MKKCLSLLLAVSLSGICLNAADTLSVKTFRHAGVVKVATPYLIDSLNNKGKAYSEKIILDSPMSLGGLENATYIEGIPSVEEGQISLIGFTVQGSRFTKGTLVVEGLDSYKAYLDTKEMYSGSFSLEPGTHDFAIKYIKGSSDKDSPSVKVVVDKGGTLTLRNDGRKIYSLDINSYGPACGGISISPSGKLITLTHSVTDENNKATSYTDLLQLSDMKTLARYDRRISWMPSSDRHYFTRAVGAKSKQLIASDPVTFEETVLCNDLPDGYYTMSPTEDFLIYTITSEGPKEGEVHQILTPDDRQPGWRDRSYLAKFDLKTGVMTTLTYGYHSSWLCDISDDGKKILFMTSRERLTKRPTTLYSIYIMDLETMKVTPVAEDDGFVGSGGSFSPDGTKVVVMGSPEAFGGIGADVLPGQTPNQYDYQLYIVDLKSGKINPITKKFNPSVQSYEWSRTDGKIYLMAENRDRKSLFRIDPNSGKSELLTESEDYVQAFYLAKDSANMVYYGQSLENTTRAYAIDTRTKKEKLLYDYNIDRLGDVDMGKGGAYEFTSSRGDRINGFYVLPPDFDPSRKYPLLVHYYGGCSPSSRYCIGAYSPQLYAAQGYVFYVINPSGASGFGQEFAARHVNTAGDVVADDIIEGTQNFIKDHPWIDKDMIGCFSASYGGFMTQLLLTKTDMFTTGISHAGISDHTSYWGEGYWGYSYSETSMANSYPWTRKDLYVDRSPLYNADKIHTPLLFLHGSADTNVPIGESIQMFTALKLLGAETAFVVVDGEDHGVDDYAKRRQWLRTIFAWFSKYLQDDSTWWDELYPEKTL